VRKLLVLSTVGTLAALAATAPASAKGPSAASVSGPGLDHALRIAGYGEGWPGSPLGPLVQFGGFFPQAYDQIPDPTTRAQPAGDLGPRYRVVYRVPGPNGTSTLLQDVYPYAKPAPVTHMQAGQRFWGDMHTHGGWFISGAGVKRALVKAGLPPSPPPDSDGGSFPSGWAATGTVAFVLLLILALRRRGIAWPRMLRTTG